MDLVANKSCEEVAEMKALIEKLVADKEAAEKEQHHHQPIGVLPSPQKSVGERRAELIRQIGELLSLLEVGWLHFYDSIYEIIISTKFQSMKRVDSFELGPTEEHLRDALETLAAELKGLRVEQ
jgi:hypothetical protein